MNAPSELSSDTVNYLTVTMRTAMAAARVESALYRNNYSANRLLASMKRSVSWCDGLDPVAPAAFGFIEKAVGLCQHLIGVRHVFSPLHNSQTHGHLQKLRAH